MVDAIISTFVEHQFLATGGLTLVLLRLFRGPAELQLGPDRKATGSFLAFAFWFSECFLPALKALWRRPGDKG